MARRAFGKMKSGLPNTFALRRQPESFSTLKRLISRSSVVRFSELRTARIVALLCSTEIVSAILPIFVPSVGAFNQLFSLPSFVFLAASA